MKYAVADIFSVINKVQPDAVIIANGQFPNDPFIIHLIKNIKYIIVCDGALQKALQHQIEPQWIIGDCDSISQALYIQFSSKIIHLNEQDSNDLTKALQLANEKHYNNVLIVGATGLREDHTIGNISILAQQINCFANIIMMSDFGVFTAHQNSAELATIPHQQISFFSFNPHTTITCKELKWPLHHFAMLFWNFATLNEALDNRIYLEIKNGTIIVFRAFEIRLPL